MALEKFDIKEWKRSLMINMAFTLIFGGICLFTPTEVEKSDGSTKTQIGICELPNIFIFLLVIAMVSLLLLAFLIYYINKFGIKKTANALIACVCVVAIFYNFYSIMVSQSSSSSYFSKFKESVIDRKDALGLDVSDGARTDLYQTCDNAGLFYNLPNISTFHSILPGSVDEFYESIDAPRNVCSHWGVSKYGLQGFLSTKYLLTNVNKSLSSDEQELTIKAFTTELQEKAFYDGEKTLVEGWNYLKTVNGIDIYENSNYVPMGFYYDGYITQSEYEKISKEDKHLVYCKALILSPEQIEKYPADLKHLNIKDFKYNYEAYKKDCETLNKNSCKGFEYGKNSFSASITTKEEEFIVFSIPYEKGWSATVNGSPITIEKVNNGFMSVKVPAGENNIQFFYKTPGLIIGIIVSTVSFTVFLCYIFFVKFFSKKQKTLLSKEVNKNE